MFLSGVGKFFLENSDYLGVIATMRGVDVVRSGVVVKVVYFLMGGFVVVVIWDGFLCVYDSDILEVIFSWCVSGDGVVMYVVWSLTLISF